MTSPPLYIWFESAPAGTPDAIIEDVPGVSDLDLVAQAIAAGRLGRFLPPKLSFSPHEQPIAGGFRTVDVARLLRDRRIPHRKRFEVLPPEEAADGA